MSRAAAGIVLSLVCAGGCGSLASLEGHGEAGADSGDPDVAVQEPDSSGALDGDKADASDDGAHEADSPGGPDGDGPADAGAIVSMQSCAPGGAGMTDCGGASDSCCTSPLVAGGTYYRTYTNDGGVAAGNTADPATVSSFRLDKYEVTVGRFRQFFNAWNGGSGWLPPKGSGVHAHLNGGLGLTNGGTPGSYETGWDPAHNGDLSPTTDNLLQCKGNGSSTWTPSPTSQENLPINCINWYEAYAFCIWDGGFLPSEAEWEYAAADGSAQLEYPWGSATPTPCPGAGCRAVYTCDYPNGAGTCTSVMNIAPVGVAPLGAAAFGQLDLAGNLFEWVLDGMGMPYVNPCTNCAQLTQVAARVVRGGGFDDTYASSLLPPTRFANTVLGRDADVGFRCARSP